MPEHHARLLRQTQAVLAQHLDTAQRPVLWASGGKDSTVLLHLCQPWRERLTILHACKDGDDGWPDISRILREHCASWGFALVEVWPWKTFPEYVSTFGWPVEVVPTTCEGATALAPSPYRTSPIKMASWLHCTYVRTIYPLIEAMLALQTDLVLTGSRLSDAPANAVFAQEVSPPQPAAWRRVNPLAAWSTEDIWRYVDTYQLTLPAYYAWKRTADFEAVDCLSCTWQPQHWAILRQYYPEEYAQRWPIVQPVFAALHAELTLRAAQLRPLLPQE